MTDNNAQPTVQIQEVLPQSQVLNQEQSLQQASPQQKPQATQVPQDQPQVKNYYSPYDISASPPPSPTQHIFSQQERLLTTLAAQSPYQHLQSTPSQESPWSGGDVLETMTRKERWNLQRKLVLRHYPQILEPEEAKDYRNKLIKCSYSLFGAILITPFIAYNLLTFKRNPAEKTLRLRNGMIIQLIFALLNYRYAKQYHTIDVEVQRKYMDHLPEAAILNFEGHYLPWYVAMKTGMPLDQAQPVYQNPHYPPQQQYIPQPNQGYMPQQNQGYMPQQNQGYMPQQIQGYPQQQYQGYIPQPGYQISLHFLQKI